MKLLTEVKVKLGYKECDIFDGIYKKYGLKRTDILRYEIVRESLDARKKPNIIISLNLAVETCEKAKNKLKNCNDIVVDRTGFDCPKVETIAKRPIVVGFGPAGIFAGLVLALSGLKPIILEQGKCASERQKDIDEFWHNRKLNKFSNVQFGEGGAGTYSDGKLASNVNNDYTKKCINEFILAGAPQEIFYSYAPHIGSDKLKSVVTNLRKRIESLGGNVLFNYHLEGFETKNGKVTSVSAKNLETNEFKNFETDALILATGHSADSVYELLDGNDCKMIQKPFAIGVRIEQSQRDVNFSQYGYDDGNLPSANYKLVEHLENGRSVFSFCMCPGGYVVASSSEQGTIVTNGMSEHARDGANANSALLVNVLPSDYDEGHILDGVKFQRKYERLAFELGGKNYNAPAEKVKDFLAEKTDNFDDKFDKIKPTYLPGITLADLRKCLPNFVAESLKLAIPKLSKKLSAMGDGENILIGVETRSSAPVQVERDENLMTNIGGLFVCGEGSGHAGGIVTSAADGAKVAEKVVDFLKTRNKR